MRAVLSCVCLFALACEPMVLGSDATGGAGMVGGTGGAAPQSIGGGAAARGGSSGVGGGSSTGGSAGPGGSVGGGSGGSNVGGTDSSVGASAGMSGAAGSSGVVGSGGSAAEAGQGGAAGVPTSGGTGGLTIPLDAEPPGTTPITVMAERDGHVAAGDLEGNVYCRAVRAGDAWRLCNTTDLQGTTVLPARPVSALHLGPDGMALVAIVPESATDIVVYQNGSIGMRPWVATPLQGVTVYGLSEVFAPTSWQVAVTDDGIYEASTAASDWWSSSGPNRISATLRVPDGLLAGAWLGTASGGLYQVDDPLTAPSSDTWASISITPPASAPVVGIARDTADRSHAYVSVASVNPSGLYVSLDGGYSYASQALPLPADASGALSKVSVNPLAPHVLYLVAFTPDAIPLRSTDYGQSWQIVAP